MKLSVVIPSCNNGKWLSKCLESILNQTFTDYEIIVVDDMSEDDSVEIAKKYLRKQDTLIVNKSKRLNGGTRNEGILKAKCEYIFCIDSDDWLYNNTVFEDVFKKLKNEDICYLSYISHTDKYELMTNVHFRSIGDALVSMTCAVWTKIIKRELFLKCLFHEGTLYEDREWNYRLLMKKPTFINSGIVGIVWNRTNPNTISGNMTKEWETYRFNYCGDLYRLIRDMDDYYIDGINVKAYIKEELEGYMKQINKLVDEL